MAVKLSWEDAETILDKLVAAGWVAKLQGNGWVLARDAGVIRVGDVFRMFVFGREAADVSEDSILRRLVSSIAGNVDGELDFSLKELLAGSGQRAARIA
jgi:DNA-binding IscR family transcriptional regulator